MGAKEPSLLDFPCVGGGGIFAVTASLLAKHTAAFPALDVMAEYRQANAWCDANTARRKTHRGMPAFLVAWLSRAQNSGRGRASNGHAPARNFREEANAQAVEAYLAMRRDKP